MPRQILVRNPTIATLLVLLLGFASAGTAAEAPTAVSPGDASKLALIEDACPTFSWGAAEATKAFDLVVYLLGGEGEEAEPVIRQRIAGSALGWTPSLDRCLERGGRYAWSVRAVGREEESDWSRPNLFQVAAGPSAVEFEAALEVVRTYLAARDGAVPEATAEGAAEPPADTDRTSAEAPTLLAPPGTQLSIDGNVDAVSFSGSGAMLASLDPANLSAGTAGIDISGNAATATDATNASDLVCTDCIGTTEIDRTGFDADLLDGLHASELVAASHEHLHDMWAGGPDNGLQIDITTLGPDKSALWGRLVWPNGGAASAAVRGENLSLNAAGYGVRGVHAGGGQGVSGTSQDGIGVFGAAAGMSGVNYGVYGSTESPSGFGGYFTGKTHIGGPLGIGTTSPAWPLSILAPQAVAQLESSSNLNGSVLELKSSVLNATLLGAINFNNFANSFPGQIAYRGDHAMTFEANGDERMRITGGGRLGINTTDPQAELHVNGRARFESNVDVNGPIGIAPTLRWWSTGAVGFTPNRFNPSVLARTAVHLPDGAIIKELKIAVEDDSAGIELGRGNFNGSSDLMAFLQVPAHSGSQTYSTTSITPGTETVDNSQYVYYFLITNWVDVDNASIRYEITSPLP